MFSNHMRYAVAEPAVRIRMPRTAAAFSTTMKESLWQCNYARLMSR
jgi:hypothetical protein